MTNISTTCPRPPALARQGSQCFGLLPMGKRTYLYPPSCWIVYVHDNTQNTYMYTYVCIILNPPAFFYHWRYCSKVYEKLSVGFLLYFWFNVHINDGKKNDKQRVLMNISLFWKSIWNIWEPCKFDSRFRRLFTLLLLRRPNEFIEDIGNELLGSVLNFLQKISFLTAADFNSDV